MTASVRVAGAAPDEWRARTEVACAGVALVALFVLAGRLHSWTQQIGTLQRIAFIAFAVLAIALKRSPCWPARHGTAIVLGIALLLRLAVVTRLPELSDDLYRYVWDGRVLASGFDPYAHAPADSALWALRDDVVHARINHPDLRTIYPPVAELGFAFVHFMMPGVAGMKWWILLHDMALCALLVRWCIARGGSAFPAIAYAWNPLIVIEYAGSGHHDPTALLPLALAFVLMTRRPSLSALAFSAAVLGKLLPILALPFLWRAWSNRARGLALATMATGLALFAWRATGGGSGLQAFAAHWRNNELVFHYVAAGLGDARARLVLGAGVALATLALALRASDLAIGARAALRTALIALPVLHPWYLGWAIVWEPLAPSWPWLLLSALALLNYGVFAPPVEGLSFHLPLIWRWVEFGLPLLLAMLLRFRRRPSHA